MASTKRSSVIVNSIVLNKYNEQDHDKSKKLFFVKKEKNIDMDENYMDL